MLKRGSWLLSLAFILVTAYAFATDESITITTYYPSPYGSYGELTTYRMKIGSTYSDTSVTVNDNNLIVEGNVGIGTSHTRTSQDGRSIKLDVANNNIITDDVYLASPKSGSPKWASEGGGGGIVSTGLYGSCHYVRAPGGGSCSSAYSPAFCSGIICACPGGYTMVSTGVTSNDSYSGWPEHNWVSCYKN